jgi:acyl carrier protein
MKTVMLCFEKHAKYPLPKDSEEECLSCRYLDIGLLDSLGFVEMVMELESEFNIFFSDDHLQTEEFQTIGGVVGLIESMIRGNHE